MVLRRSHDAQGNWRDYCSNEEDTQLSSQHSTATLMSQEPEISIHPLASQEGILVKVDPPRCPPNDKLSHVPCDIVLVIDVSWSMNKVAPMVGLDDDGVITKEHAGYSVLDITKHAALTVLETLDDRDRLGVVTFSTTAKVVRELAPMNSVNKKATAKCIRALEEENSTNLWQGIVEGLGQFKATENTGRVPAVLVLTDGQPNHQNPLQGYVAALQNMGPLPATIHTFGFGNDIKSGLLKSISEVGCGSYSFIPDAGMVGTVFVNAVAHLQSTFANRGVLTLTYPEALCLRRINGETVESRQQEITYDKSSLESTVLALDTNGEFIVNIDRAKCRKLTISLSNLQYGQSRDIYLRSEGLWSSDDAEKLDIVAEFEYSRMHSARYVVQARQDALLPTSLPDSFIAYHQSRAMLCEFLSSFFPLRADGEHEMPLIPPASASNNRARFNDLLNMIPAKGFNDAYNMSIMKDLLGQIKLAVFDNAYLMTWGPHYFLSLWDAHAKQVRNTFKDPGVQMYDLNSPLFLKCQQQLTYAFDTAVKAPEPSLGAQADEKYSSGRVAVSMSSYNDCDYPCFSASTLVTLADGSRVPVSQLRKGVAVRTPSGSRKVASVLRTRVRSAILCRIQSLTITPWHPVMDGESWTFPARITKTAIRYSGAIYSILLERDPDPRAHAIQVGGVWAVTLGHGILGGKDVRAHQFLGDYFKVSKALATIGTRQDGIAVASGVNREKRSGRLDGFKRGNQIGDYRAAVRSQCNSKAIEPYISCVHKE